MFQTSSCGLGGPTNPDGPCSGSYQPKDAGSHVFDGLSSASAVKGIIGAGAIIAGLLFVFFCVYAVSKFFGKKDKAANNGKLVADPNTDLSAAEAHARSYYGKFYDPEKVRPAADYEDDSEDDSEESDSRGLAP